MECEAKTCKCKIPKIHFHEVIIKFNVRFFKCKKCEKEFNKQFETKLQLLKLVKQKGKYYLIDIKTNKHRAWF